MNTTKSILVVSILFLAILLTGCAPALDAMGKDLPNTQPSTEGRLEGGPSSQDKSQIAVTPEDSESTDPASAETQALTEGSPEEAAVLFYQEYIERSSLGLPTLGSQKFQAQKYLSQGYLRQVDEIRAGFEGGGFDPILKAQALPPGDVRVKESVVSEDQAEVLLQWVDPSIQGEWTRRVSLEQMDGAWKIVPDRVEAGNLSPEATVEAFYGWYIDYAMGGSEFRNPLVNKAYLEAPYLHPALVDKIDRLLSGAEGRQADPFLCAQDIPEAMKATASFYNQGRPVVLMGSSFQGHSLTADLVRVDFNQWAIRDVTCGITPEGAARGFYTWALGYMTQGGEMHNPWVDRAYQGSQFLSQEFVANLDQMLDSGEPLPADPVLLAQDLPQAFNTQPCPEADCALVNLQFGEAMIRQLRVEMEAGAVPPRIAAVSHVGSLESPQPSQDVDGIDLWVPLVDEVFGFSLRYPGEWLPRGLKVTDMHTPQDYAVMRNLSFYTPGQVGATIPIYLDVVVGDQELMTAFYPGMDQAQKDQINGCSARRYLNDLGHTTYIFQHPVREGVWLTAVYLGDEGKADIFEVLVSTITFGE